MIVASMKRKENIAEYLLYMWQIEDIIRANGLDMDKIKANVIDRYGLTDEKAKEMSDWYESLIDMMRLEGVTESGHLQLNKMLLYSWLNCIRHCLRTLAFLNIQLSSIRRYRIL